MAGAKQHMYDIAVNELESQLVADSTKVDTELVRTKFRQAYERSKEQDKRSFTGKRGEKAFSALMDAMEELDEKAMAAFIKQFKGTCNGCGEYGHKKANCPQGNGDGEKINGLCFYCGRGRHKKKDCEKRMADMAAKAERAALAVGMPVADASDEEEELNFSDAESIGELRLIALDGESVLTDGLVSASNLHDGSSPQHSRLLEETSRKRLLIKGPDDEPLP